MPKITKRALWGFSPESVDETVRELQAAHEEQMQRLHEELAELTASNETMRAEIANLSEAERLGTDEHVASLLLQAHLEHTKHVFQLYEELEQMEQKQAEVLEVSHLHRETVFQEVLEKLKQLETNLQQRVKEGEHGGSSDL